MNVFLFVTGVFYLLSTATLNAVNPSGEHVHSLCVIVRACALNLNSFEVLGASPACVRVYEASPALLPETFPVSPPVQWNFFVAVTRFLVYGGAFLSDLSGGAAVFLGRMSSRLMSSRLGAEVCCPCLEGETNKLCCLAFMCWATIQRSFCVPSVLRKYVMHCLRTVFF